MITKYNYSEKNGVVSRTPEYSFTAAEELADRLAGIDNKQVIENIANTTLKGEAERDLIGLEDTWFKIQTELQNMDKEREALELQLKNGDKNGNPLNPEQQASIQARIAECKEGTMVVEKEFYDHYNRQTYKVKEVHQTPYTISLEKRNDLEENNPYLAGLRGVASAPARPIATLSKDKENSIRKELVRQQIDVQVGDDKDLIADMSNALSALIKQVNGQAVSSEEQANLSKYIERQTTISNILKTDYLK